VCEASNDFSLPVLHLLTIVAMFAPLSCVTQMVRVQDVVGGPFGSSESTDSSVGRLCRQSGGNAGLDRRHLASPPVDRVRISAPAHSRVAEGFIFIEPNR